MDQHARLAPSSAGVIVYCPGSVQMQERFPEQEPTEDTKEGDAMHWVCASVLNAFKGGTGQITTSSYVGKAAPNGVIITEEMAEAADEFVFDVLNTVQKFGGLQSLQVEHALTKPVIHRDNWGTPDAFAFDSKTLTFYLWDFKGGHRFVEVFENWQELNYAILATDGMKCTIVLRIVQPRCFTAEPVREWVLHYDDLRPYRNRLETAFEQAVRENPPINTGPHCRDCRARHACKGAQQAAAAALEYSLNVSGAINEYSPDALGTILNALNRAAGAIDLLQTAVSEQVLQLAKQGVQVPGWTLEQGKGRKKWAQPIPEVLALGQMFGLDLAKPPAAITPNQAQKLGIDGAVIDAYSVQPSTGLKLVKDGGVKAKHVFTQPRGYLTNGNTSN